MANDNYKSSKCLLLIHPDTLCTGSHCLHVFSHLFNSHHSHTMAFYGLGDAFNPPQDRSLGQVPGEHVIPLLERTDDSAAQMILALVHDCFIAINHLHRGVHPEDFFLQRFRLLSLYITPWEIAKYEADLGRMGLKSRYESLVSLNALRRRTLFSPRERQATLIEHLARGERHDFQVALVDVLAEPFVGMDSERASTISTLLRDVRGSLDTAPVTQERADEICNAFRAFFQLPPWSPSSASTQPAKPLTPEREIAMIYDIFHALNAFYLNPRHVPAERLRDFYISLRKETKDTVYYPNDTHARFFVMARDVLCGLLAGPFPMRKSGAYHAFVAPLLGSYRTWYLFQERDVWSQLAPDLMSIAQWFAEDNLQPAKRQRMRRLLLWLFTSSNLTGLGLLLPDLYPSDPEALLNGVEMGTVLGLKDD
ncbi:hypothetical protein BDZ89DRAFT_1158393 [Hymenopellis radicata]|nr:hypothetical protein BDZ89DRAFT_1158393 [Hymenopellis radicata]